MRTLLIAALILYATRARAANNEIQLGCMSPNFAYVNDNPVAAIASAIDKDKSSFRFRVTWENSLGGAADAGTMLYDRKRKLLKFYNWGGRIEGFAYQRGYLFMRIDDKIITQIVKKNNNRWNSGRLNPFFSLPKLLPAYGCHVHKTVDFTKGHE